MSNTELDSNEVLDQQEVVIPQEYYSKDMNAVRKPSSLRKLDSHFSAEHDKNGKVGDKLTTRNNGFSISKKLLRIVPGLNLRSSLSEEHIAGFENSYRIGQYVPPIVVRAVMIDGELCAEVMEGHNRFMAVMRVDEIDLIEVNEFRGNDVESIILMLTSANGKPLPPMDKGDGYNRLVNAGMSPSEIARRLKITPASVSQTLKLMKMPYLLQQMVRDNKISATYARELFEEHGSNVLNHIEANFADKKTQAVTDETVSPEPVAEKTQEAAETELTTPKSEEAPASPKITKKRMTSAPKAPKLGKEEVQAMCGLLESLASQFNVDDLKDDQNVSVTLTRDEAFKLQQIGAELQALKEENEKLAAEKVEAEKQEADAKALAEKQSALDI